MHGNPSAPANTPVAQESVGPEADDRLAYSVNEAAQRLGVGPMTLYREIAEGKLPAIRIRLYATKRGWRPRSLTVL